MVARPAFLRRQSRKFASRDRKVGVTWSCHITPCKWALLKLNGYLCLTFGQAGQASGSDRTPFSSSNLNALQAGGVNALPGIGNHDDNITCTEGMQLPIADSISCPV